MKIAFRTTKLQKQYEQSINAIKAYGKDVGKRYVQRINIIKATNTLDELKSLPNLRCHQLKGDQKGKWAISLTGFYRLIFSISGNGAQIIRIEKVSKHYND